ncbi:GNAT family N-acetyltransferase [Orenia marismortui]|nr:GNAT family N-acetyltransferase [Orenia marismortui]
MKKKMHNIEVAFVSTEKELQKIFGLRKEVFVKEQGVPNEIEVDKFDYEAKHLIAKSSGNVIGTCRLLTEDKVGKIGRMAVKSDFRGKGVGSLILDKLVEFSKSQNLEELLLHAQIHAVKFYKKSGFEICSDKIIEEAGIKHLKMNMRL